MDSLRTKINEMTLRQVTRWTLSFATLFFTWWITPFSLFQNRYLDLDFRAAEQDAVMSLQRYPYRYDFAPRGQQRHACPGENCLFNLNVASSELRFASATKSDFSRLMTTEGWRGVMYLRWDVLVPSFVTAKNQPIAFDFYGVAGKSWRLFVNGIEMGTGRGGLQSGAVSFPAPDIAGTPLTLGLEVDVGRSLAPGLILGGQTFLSRPSIASHMRSAYRGFDRESHIPLVIGYTILGLVGALSCFLTPFYREILAFSLWVGATNWRAMLWNDLVPFPSFLNVDFVTFAAMLDAASLACQWAFFVFFFRMRERFMWIPAAVYAALIPVFWSSGRYGIAIDILIFMHRFYEIQLALAYLCGAVLAFHVARVTKGKAWAKFRSTISRIIGLMSLAVVLAYLLLIAKSFYGRGYSDFFENQLVFKFTDLIPKMFVVTSAFAMALEWALIVRDRQRVVQRFGTVVDPRLVHDIIRSPEGQSRRINHAIVLFTDLRAFSKMCEVFPPDRVMTALNEYLDVVTNAVQSHGGVVDKFVGDAVMALWGVPEVGVNDSYAAVLASIDIRLRIARLNERRIADGEFQLDVGISIHGGPTIFGAIGNGSRVDHTVIGPTINIASRLEGVTKELGCDIVISHSVLEKVESMVLIEDLGLLSIRGMASQVGAAKLIGVQLADGEFVIGNEFLQEVVNLRRPGRVAGVPPHASIPDYANSSSAIVSGDAA